MVICARLFCVFQRFQFFRQVRCLLRVSASWLESHWSVPTFGGCGSYFLDSSINSVTIMADEKGPKTWMSTKYVLHMMSIILIKMTASNVLCLQINTFI